MELSSVSSLGVLGVAKSDDGGAGFASENYARADGAPTSVMAERATRREANDYVAGTTARFFGLFFWPIWVLLVLPVFLPVLLFLIITVVGTPSAAYSLAHLCYGFYGDRLFTHCRPATAGRHPFLAALIWLSYVCVTGPVLVLMLVLFYMSFLWVLLEFIVFTGLLLVPAIFVFAIAACVLGPGAAAAELGQSLRQSTDFTFRVVLWTICPMWDVRANVARSEKRWRLQAGGQVSTPTVTEAGAVPAQRAARWRARMFWTVAGLLFVALEIILPVFGLATDILFFEETQAAWHQSEYSSAALAGIIDDTSAVAAAFQVAYSLALVSLVVSTICHVYFGIRLIYQLWWCHIWLGHVVVASSGTSALGDVPLPPAVRVGAVERTFQFLQITLGDLLQLCATFLFLLAINGVSTITRAKLIVASVSVALALALFLFRAKYGRVTNRAPWKVLVFAMCLVYALIVPVVLNVVVTFTVPVIKDVCAGDATVWYPAEPTMAFADPGAYDVTMCATFDAARLNLTIPYTSDCDAQASILGERSYYCYNPTLVRVFPAEKCLDQSYLAFPYVAELAELVVANDCVVKTLYFPRLLTLQSLTIANDLLLQTVAFGPLQALGSLSVENAPSLTSIVCLSEAYAGHANWLLDADAQARYSAGDLTISC